MSEKRNCYKSLKVKQHSRTKLQILKSNKWLAVHQAQLKKKEKGNWANTVLYVRALVLSGLEMFTGKL